MATLKLYHGDSVRIGDEWPVCLDAEKQGDGTIVFTGTVLNSTIHGRKAYSLQIRRAGRDFAVILLPYFDSEPPEEWRDRELLWECRPKSWPKEVADGAE